MNALVIGYGSIGNRHVKVLQSLGCKVSVLSRRKIDYQPAYQKLSEAMAKEKPEYVIIANETSAHAAMLKDLEKAGFQGKVLVEKPLFHRAEKISKNGFQSVFVAYNLRFHPLLRKLRKLLTKERCLSARIYVGSFLPKWHPQKDYTHLYSAKKNEGGGVLRDLSHELDYVLWMLGPWKRIAAQGGHFSRKLKISSDDIFSCLLETEKCPVVHIEMNYLDKLGRREILINTEDHTFFLDLKNGKLMVDEKVEHLEVDRDFTYREEHAAILKRDVSEICSYEEGYEIMTLIEAAEKSIADQEWVTR